MAERWGQNDGMRMDKSSRLSLSSCPIVLPIFKPHPVRRSRSLGGASSKNWFSAIRGENEFVSGSMKTHWTQISPRMAENQKNLAKKTRFDDVAMQRSPQRERCLAIPVLGDCRQACRGAREYARPPPPSRIRNWTCALEGDSAHTPPCFFGAVC